MTASTGALRIGGNTIWGEWFQGDIDEVRIYNRALAGSRDPGGHEPAGHEPGLDGAVCAGHARRQPAALTLCAAELGAGHRQRRRRPIQRPPHRRRRLHAVGREPDRAADRDDVHRSVAAGTYFYKVTAEDAAGNIGPASNEASAVVGDTSAPGAPGTLSARRRRSARRRLRGAPPLTTSAWFATTSTADSRGLHAVGCQPDRAADRHRLRRIRSPPAPTPTRSPPRTPRATSARSRTRRRRR